MLLPAPALRDPFDQPFDFLLRQFVSGINRRHAYRFILGSDATHELALLWMAGDDGPAAFAQIGMRMGFGIESQLAFVVRRIRAMADKTFVRQNRTDVAAEINAVRRGLGPIWRGPCRLAHEGTKA